MSGNGHGAFFSRQIDHLAHEHRVIVPDLRGHGASDRPAEGHTVAGYADDVHALLEQLQTDPDALIEGLVAMMLHEPYDADVAWMASEMRRVPATIAATILVSQTLKDYRELLPQISVPCLVAFGADPKLTSPDAGRYIAQRIPGARLELFERSSHAPFWEEPERFNAVLTAFLETLDAGQEEPMAR